MTPRQCRKFTRNLKYDGEGGKLKIAGWEEKGKRASLELGGARLLRLVEETWMRAFRANNASKSKKDENMINWSAR
jgi:hypothetical protein